MEHQLWCDQRAVHSSSIGGGIANATGLPRTFRLQTDLREPSQLPYLGASSGDNRPAGPPKRSEIISRVSRSGSWRIHISSSIVLNDRSNANRRRCQDRR